MTKQKSKYKLFKRAHQAGFSLVEILVATTILSFMMAGIYTMVDQNSKTTKSVTTEDRDYLTGHVAMSKIEDDLAQIYSPLYFAARKRPRPDDNQAEEDQGSQNPNFPFKTIVDIPAPQLESPDKSTIVFFNSSNRRKYEDEKQSRFQWIKYYLKSREKEDNENPDIKTGDFQLIRKVINEGIYKLDLDWDNEREQVMLDNVKEFTVGYWDAKRKKFVESLRELDVDERLAPKGFQIVLTWYDRAGTEHESIKVVRPLWPTFDTLKDELERRPKKAAGTNPSGTDTQPRFEPDPDEGDFE